MQSYSSAAEPRTAPAPQTSTECPSPADNIQIIITIKQEDNEWRIVLYCIVYKFLKWPKYKPQGPLGIDIISSRLLSRKR